MENKNELDFFWKKFLKTGAIEIYLAYKECERKMKEVKHGKSNNNKSNSPKSNALSR